jgi:hypothetical protein
MAGSLSVRVRISWLCEYVGIDWAGTPGPGRALGLVSRWSPGRPRTRLAAWRLATPPTR